MTIGALKKNVAWYIISQAMNMPTDFNLFRLYLFAHTFTHGVTKFIGISVPKSHNMAG